jgi:hypothetical protein
VDPDIGQRGGSGDDGGEHEQQPEQHVHAADDELHAAAEFHAAGEPIAEFQPSAAAVSAAGEQLSDRSECGSESKEADAG